MKRYFVETNEDSMVAFVDDSGKAYIYGETAFKAPLTLEVAKAAQAAHELLHIRVVGLVRFAPDVTPDLARATIGSLSVLGALQAPAEIKNALADRIL